jgi:hypothetical protein
MTAAFDATSGTDHRFTDALSGSDGTGDPSIMMPVLDVYPDALSAPMPNDLIPVIVPPVLQPPQPGVRAEPVTGPANRSGNRPPPAQRGQTQRSQTQRGQTQRPAQQAAPRQPAAARQQPARPAAPVRPVPPRPAVQPYRPISQAPPARPTGPSFTWQGKTMTAADLSAMFRGSMPNQPAQVDRESFQATHPQSAGSGAPSAVAPAAPMASQYSGHGQARNEARERSQERRRTAPTPDRGANSRRRSSVGAVLVFFFVILFASGLGQKAIDLLSELFNR